MNCLVRDIPLYYEEYGEGKPVLCLHGYAVDHRLMTGCLEPVFAKTQGYRRIYPDLPGMGRSPAAAWLRSADDMLAVIRAFTDTVIPGESFLVAGESYGGYMALGLIHTMRARIGGAMLICPVVIADAAARTVPGKRLLWQSPDFCALPEDADQSAFLDIAVIAAPAIYQAYQRDIAPGAAAGDADFLARYMREGYRLSFEDALQTPDFHKPMSIVTGRQDHWVGYADAFSLLAGCSRATFAALDGCGHNLQIENEALFRRLAADWLWRVELDEKGPFPIPTEERGGET